MEQRMKKNIIKNIQDITYILCEQPKLYNRTSHEYYVNTKYNFKTLHLYYENITKSIIKLYMYTT